MTVVEHFGEDALSNAQSRALSKASKQLFCDPGLHGLRHTCASLLLSAGVQPNVVQQRLGHKRIEITLSIYAHVLPGQQRDAARRLSSLLYGH